MTLLENIFRVETEQAPLCQHLFSEITLGTMNILSLIICFSLHMKN